MSGEKKPVVAFTRYTPYMIIDVERVENQYGEPVKTGAVTSLCRCGESKGKPFCDDSHSAKGIDGDKCDDRAPYKWKEYYGKDITVHFNLGVCSHDGSCVRMAPEVFNINRRPWIFPDNGDYKKIIDVIHHCPSGALKFTLNGVTHIDYYQGAPKIKVAARGPLEFYGGIELKDDQRSKPETSDHFTLCRCGHSANKPFCDGRHLKIKFSGQ